MERVKEKRAILYHSLPPHSIRLFRLNASTSAADVGNLEVVALDNAPPYYALSHSWGTKARSSAVRIDGQVLAVSPDLAICIRRLQELAAERSNLSIPVKYIWIDNICINQDNISERSSQVKLLERVYMQSLRTLIWLGPQSSSCSTAWQLVDQIYEVFKSQNPAAKTSDDIPVKMYSDMDHAASGLPKWNSQEWVNLKGLLEIEWFSRIWVVQEVVLSPSDPIILHGKIVYPWHRLAWVAAWMRRNGYIRLAQIPEELHNVDTMCNIQQTHSKWPLDALLSITQIKFHATDQRDKVYALLGLAAECGDASRIPDSIQPDYAADVTQIYQKAARFLLEQNCSLAMLTRAHATSGSLTRKQRIHDFDLPSWVPDWSDLRMVESRRISFSWIDYSDPVKTPCLGFPKHYNASAELKLKLYNTPDNLVLRVSGIRMDEVVRSVPFNKENCSQDEFKQAFASSLAQSCDAAFSLLKESDLHKWTNLFIKSTTAEQHRLSGRDWNQSFKDGLAYLYSILLASESLMANFIRNSHDDNSRNKLRQLSNGRDPNEYAALAQNFCFNKSFIMTSAGRMGIGPYDTRAGDTVSVILGGGVPYIIRNQEAHWEFVGEVYMQGLMNGEAIGACEQGLKQEEILNIQ